MYLFFESFLKEWPPHDITGGSSIQTGNHNPLTD